MEEKTAVYLQRIQSAIPTLQIHEYNINQDGFINDVVIVNNTNVFRFGKHEWAEEHVLQERRCLQLVQKYVDTATPKWTTYAPDFIGYPMITGSLLQRYDILRWSNKEQDKIAEQIGTFLYQLHTIPHKEIEANNIAPSLTNRKSEDWLKLYEAVQEKLIPNMMPFAQDWVQQHFAPLVNDPSFMDSEHCIMNGDVTPYHLLVNLETKQLNGIIDFGTAGTGDPACDFACLIDAYGESFVRRVGKYYANDLAEKIERARFWAGTLALQWALAGIRKPDNALWATVHIGRAQDVMPIGSGW